MSRGEWRIEPAELNRVYPPVQANETRPEQAHQDALIAELRSALADMRRDRDEWRAGATPRPARAQGRAGAARAGAQATADMVAVVEIDRLTPEGQPRKEEETPS
jgi:hypothetical protein